MPVVAAPAPTIPPSVPPSAPALQQLVRALGMREPDLRDQVCILVCMPRYLAKCAADLPANPRGALGAFAVTVPTGTTAVAGDAFRDCAGLAQVTLPATVTVIEAGPAGGGIVGAFSGCSSLSEIALPPNLTEIGTYAFHACTSLSKITLPPNLTKIEGHTFYGCTSLSEIALPPNLTEIGDAAFRECTSLREIALPSNLTEIGHSTFHN